MAFSALPFWAQALQRELEALASTLVMRPIQPRSWPLLEAIGMAWRLPAIVLFLLFMGKEGEGRGKRIETWCLAAASELGRKFPHHALCKNNNSPPRRTALFCRMA